VAFDSISKVITRIKSTQAGWQKHYQFQQISEQWSEIVGEMVAQQTRPTGIYDRILKVAVSTPQWSQALAFQRIKLLEKLQGILKNPQAIVDIHFSTAQWYSAPKLPPGMDKPMLLVARSQHGSSAREDRQSKQSALEPEESIQLQMPPQDAKEAFERWAKLVKQRTAKLPKCTRCGCATNTEELERWRMCHICASQHLFK
jgi:predicted nucleic acid-binding Zn ribbon protein